MKYHKNKQTRPGKKEQKSAACVAIRRRNPGPICKSERSEQKDYSERAEGSKNGFEKALKTHNIT